MATKIPYRFVFDTFFFEKKDDDLLADLAYDLTFITSKASGNKKKQNIMSEKSRREITKKIPNWSLEVARYFLNKVDDPEAFEDIGDEITRTLKYAIYLTYYWPNKVIIFTSKDKIEVYKKSKHYQNIKSIKFMYDDDAIESIRYWAKMCRDETFSSCD